MTAVRPLALMSWFCIYYDNYFDNNVGKVNAIMLRPSIQLAGKIIENNGDIVIDRL